MTADIVALCAKRSELDPAFYEEVVSFLQVSCRHLDAEELLSAISTKWTDCNSSLRRFTAAQWAWLEVVGARIDADGVALRNALADWTRRHGMADHGEFDRVIGSVSLRVNAETLRFLNGGTMPDLGGPDDEADVDGIAAAFVEGRDHE